MGSNRDLKKTKVLTAAYVDQSGFTLVELMISMGLFTISLLAVLSLFTFGSTQSLRVLFMQNSQQAIMDFQENFDAALSNTTRTYLCGCDSPSQDGTSRRKCTFNSAQSIVPAPAVNTQNNPDVAAPAPANTKSWTLFDFESEYSQTPLDVPLTAELTTAYCQRYTAAAGASPHYRDRPQQGCKRVYRLRFWNNFPQSAGTPAVPPTGFLYGGRIQLMVCTGQYTYNAGGSTTECVSSFGACSHALNVSTTPTELCDNGFTRIAEIPGVRSVTCGQEQVLGDTTTEAENFRLDFTYIPSVTDDPNVINVQGGNFERTYSFSSTFRNLVERGIFFGRPSKTSNCIPDGWSLDTPNIRDKNFGVYCDSITDCKDNPCCSGTISFATASSPICMAKSGCWPAGHVLDGTNWPQERYSCCSNQAVLKDIGGDTYECL